MIYINPKPFIQFCKIVHHILHYISIAIPDICAYLRVLYFLFKMDNSSTLFQGNSPTDSEREIFVKKTTEL